MRSLLLAALVALLCLAAPLTRLETVPYDLEMQLKQSLKPPVQDPRIRIIGMEASSYDRIDVNRALWVPFYARVCKAALDAGAIAVGLDVLPTFAEPSGVAELGRVALAYPGKLVMIAYLDPDRTYVELPERRLVAILGIDNVALSNLSLDRDGVARAQQVAPVIYPFEGRSAFPFLASALAQRVEKESGGPERILVDQSGRPFPEDRFEDVLTMKPDQARNHYAGKVVLIGSRAKLDQDLVVTPGGSGFGVDYQAEVLSNLLQHDAMQRVPLWVSWLALTAIGLLLVREKTDWRLSALSLAGSLLLWVAVGVGAFLHGWVVPLTAGTLALALQWTLASLLRSRSQQRLLHTLEGYVSPEILSEMLADPKSWNDSLTQRREITVLFSDINNFSTTSENESAESVAGKLNEHYREMARVIFEHDGTIIRFVGDQFMVLFGAPRRHSAPERAAVETAIAMHRRLHELAELGHTGFYEVKIGIHRGPMLLAVLGDDLKHEYTAVGDAANVAARIQDLCKQVGETTLISQEIFERLPAGRFETVDKGEHKVKGRHGSVQVHGVRGVSAESPPAS